MRRAAFSILVATLLCSSPSTAQTTSRCYWVGNVWTCDQSQQQSSGIDWSQLRSPNNPSFTDSFRQGAEIGERARRAREERERHEAQMELYRAQTEAAQRQATTPQAAAAAAPSPDYVQEWYRRAEPRMGLYPDFQEKVFANDVRISPQMVMLMSGSDYAADIAYYLTTHQAEAVAISQLSLLDAARAIDRIETDLKQFAVPSE